MITVGILFISFYLKTILHISQSRKYTGSTAFYGCPVQWLGECFDIKLLESCTRDYHITKSIRHTSGRSYIIGCCDTMCSRHETGWNGIYHRADPEELAWELGYPRQALRELVESGQVVPRTTLDLCCGVGTNPIYLAQKGFDVTALDNSEKAVEYAKEKARESYVPINLLVGDFVHLPFKDQVFDFVFDFGCFHHVKEKDRMPFIQGVHRSLRPYGVYFLVCFSYKNGSAWNHFKRTQIVELFGNSFVLVWIRHVSSIEGDKVTRFFYEVLMKKRVVGV